MHGPARRVNNFGIWAKLFILAFYSLLFICNALIEHYGIYKWYYDTKREDTFFQAVPLW